MKDNAAIDIAVCYHKKSLVFESDALKPMQLGRAAAKTGLGMRGDDTGDNISERNRFYSEDTAFWWLWKNSGAEIKGCMHYRRLLDLNRQGKKDYNIALEDIKDPQEFVSGKLGLDSKNIKKWLEKADILAANKLDIRTWLNGTIADNFNSVHFPYHWKIAMEIIRRDFPQIYPAARRIAGGTENYFHNLVIMKAPLFDEMCRFCFHITEELSKQIDETRLEFNDNWRGTARYLSFVWERMCGIYLSYLAEKEYKILEFAAVFIAPRGTNIEDLENYRDDAYDAKKQAAAIKPAFDKNAVTIMMATNNNYAPYCAVAIQSVKDNADGNRNYDIVIASRDISGHNKRLIEAMSGGNFSVRIIDISGFINDVDASLFKVDSFFSPETYYRIFISRIFAGYDKILYLDVDMAVMRDVAELYDTDIGDNWWGAAYDEYIKTCCFVLWGNWGTRTIRPYIKNVLKMDFISDYFQAGVMIWNVRQCIQDNVMERCLERLREIGVPIFVDQDVMNSVANGKHIFYLSPYWNVAWNPPFAWTDCAGTESYKTAMHWLENPYILHYCGSIKPWNEPWRENAEYFWRYARKTPFYEKMICNAVPRNDNAVNSIWLFRKARGFFRCLKQNGVTYTAKLFVKKCLRKVGLYEGRKTAGYNEK